MFFGGAVGLIGVGAFGFARGVGEEPGRALLVVVEVGRGFGGDLLDRQALGAVEVVAGAVVEQQRQGLGGVPGEVLGRALDRLRLAQTVAVVAVGLFDFGTSLRRCDLSRPGCRPGRSRSWSPVPSRAPAFVRWPSLSKLNVVPPPYFSWAASS